MVVCSWDKQENGVVGHQESINFGQPNSSTALCSSFESLSAMGRRHRNLDVPVWVYGFPIFEGIGMVERWSEEGQE